MEAAPETDVSQLRRRIAQLEEELRSATAGASSARPSLSSPDNRYGMPAALHALNILDTIGDAVATLDADWHFTYVNDRTATLARMPKERMLGRVFWDLFPELAHHASWDHYQRAMRDRVTGHFEEYYRPYDLWVEVDLYPAADGLLLLVRDISDQKRSLDKWREAEGRARTQMAELEAIYRTAPVGLIFMSPELRYMRINERAAEINGASVEAHIGRTIWEILPDIADRIAPDYQRVLRTGEPIENIEVRGMTPAQPGVERHFRVSYHPVHSEKGEVLGVTAVVQDVTERSAMEEQLRHNEEQLRLVIDGVPGLVSYIDKDLRYRFVNRQYSRWFDIPRERFEGRTISEILGPPSEDMIRPYAERALQGELVSFERSVLYHDKERQVRATYVPDRGPDGDIRGFVVLVDDVTGQHNAREQLRASEAKYRSLANALPQFVWTADAIGTTEFLNQHWYDYTGMGAGDDMKDAWLTIMHPDDHQPILQNWMRATERKERFEMEYRIRRASDGSFRWHLANHIPILDASGNIRKWVGTAFDIEDRKRAEDELRRTKAQVLNILDSVTESFIAVNREWRLTYVNQRVADKVGRPREELLGRNLWEISPGAEDSEFFTNYQRVMTERTPARFEMYYPPTASWYEVYAHPTDEGLSAFIADITPRKRAEAALRDSEERFRQIVETAGEGIAMFDGECRFLFVNQRMGELIGYNADELVGHSALDFVPEEERERAQSGFQSRLVGDREGPREYPMVHRDGSVRWMRISASLIRDEKGREVAVLGMLTDMTAAKLAEAALRASEERYRFLSEALPQFVWTDDGQGHLDYINRHWSTYTGLTLEQTQTGEWLRLVHPDDRERMEKALQGRSEGHEFDLEFRLRRAEDESFRWHLGRGRYVTNPQGEKRWLGVGIDIEDRKRAETALRDSEERFRRIVETASEGIWIIDQDTRTTFVNARMCELLGYTAEEMLGRSCFDFIHPEDHERGVHGFEKRKAGDLGPREYRVHRKDGEAIWLSFTAGPVRDGEGRLTGVLAMCTDVTERKRAEQELARVNQDLARRVKEFEALLEVTPVGIAIALDPKCAHIRFNRALSEWVGIEAGTNVSRTGLNPAQMPFRLRQDGRDLRPEELPLQTAAREGRELHVELDIVREDGRVIHVYGYVSPLFDEDGKPRGSVGAFVDMTERQAMEVALRRANAALEQFAYAAAHDLQEPARNVQLYAQLLARHLGPSRDEETKRFLDGAIESARRMQHLIQDLLSYTRAVDDPESEAHADANEVIEHVKQNLRPAIEDSGAQVLHGILPGVRMHATHLTQLLQNLISNSLKYRTGESPRVFVTAERRDGSWVFAVRDNGIGIAPEHHERIFKVFKRLHGHEISGTGIGLAICRRIVTHYGGRIWVDSTPGAGTTVLFTIPEPTAKGA